MWSYGAALRNSLVDLLDTGDREEEEEEEEEENKVECDLTVSMKAIVNGDLILIV